MHFERCHQQALRALSYWRLQPSLPEKSMIWQRTGGTPTNLLIPLSWWCSSNWNCTSWWDRRKAPLLRHETGTWQLDAGNIQEHQPLGENAVKPKLASARSTLDPPPLKEQPMSEIDLTQVEVLPWRTIIFKFTKQVYLPPQPTRNSSQFNSKSLFSSDLPYSSHILYDTPEMSLRNIA
jgi:hypothetical protein